MIPKLAGGSLVGALAQHDSKCISSQKAPALVVDGIPAESQNVPEVTRRHRQVANGEHTPGANDLSHPCLQHASRPGNSSPHAIARRFVAYRARRVDS